MNCDVMACFFAFMADLNIIDAKFNITDLHITTLYSDDIIVEFKILDFNRTFEELEYDIVNLVKLHCGLVDDFSYNERDAIFKIKFKDRHIYYEISVLDDEDSKFYDKDQLNFMRNTALQPIFYEKKSGKNFTKNLEKILTKNLDFPNSN